MNDDFYGDKFRWFTGVVKDVGSDSRVRVRIFGIHHTEDTTKVSDGDLPWAMVMFPTTGGQTSGGNANHGLVNGTWVVGFFADNEDSQQPIIIGVINGGRGSVNSSSGGQTPSNNNSNTTTPVTPDTGGTPTDPTLAPSTTQLTGSGNPQKMYNFFWEKIKESGAVGEGASLKCICAAIVGNAQGEAGASIDPNASNGNTIGIAQWLGDRKKKLGNFCGMTSVPSKGNAPPLEKQLDFLWWELTQGDEKPHFKKLLTSQNIEEATANAIMYERDESTLKYKTYPDRTHPVYQNKLKFAMKALSTLSYTGGVS
jgi:hypothetical protein